MNFMTQLGVLAVILIILIILIKSNRTLEKIYMEEQGMEGQNIEEEKNEPQIPKLEVPKLEIPKWPFRKEKKTDLQENSKKGWKSRDGMEEGSHLENGEDTHLRGGHPARSQSTIPVEEAGKTPGVLIEILDERGCAIDTRKVFYFPYSIGRNEENDLVLDDLSVSSFHASLEQEGDKVIVVDQGSLNKLNVGGRQEIKVPVSGEVEIGFGNTRLRFLKEIKRAEPTFYYAGNSLMEEWH